MAISVLQSLNVLNATNSATSYTSSSFTVGAGTLLAAVIHGYLDTGATAATISSVTYGGVAMSVAVQGKGATSNRVHSAIALLKSPPAGANTLTITHALTQRACRIDLYELDGEADLAFLGDVLGGGETTATAAQNIAIAVAEANSLILSGVAVQADAGAFTGTNGVTVAVQGATGITSFNDVSGASGYEAIATPATTGHDYSWVTANAMSYVAIVINPAPAYTQKIVKTNATAYHTGTAGPSHQQALTLSGWYRPASVGSQALLVEYSGRSEFRRFTTSLNLFIKDSVNTTVWEVSVPGFFAVDTLVHLYVQVDLSGPTAVIKKNGVTLVSGVDYTVVTALTAGTGLIYFATSGVAINAANGGGFYFDGEVSDVVLIHSTGAAKPAFDFWNGGTPPRLASLYSSAYAILGGSMEANALLGDTAKGWNDSHNRATGAQASTLTSASATYTNIINTLTAAVNGGGLYDGYNKASAGSWLSTDWGTLVDTNAPGGETVVGLHWWAADAKTYLLIAGAGKEAWFTGRKIWINGVEYTCSGAATSGSATYATVSTSKLFTNGSVYTVAFQAPYSSAVPVTVTPGVGAVTIAGLAPTATGGTAATVTPGVSDVTITGHAPTVTIEAPVTLTPGVGAVTITGQAPILAASATATTGTGAVTVAGLAPSVSAAQTLTPGVGAVSITGQAPDVGAGAAVTVTPGVGAVSLTGLAPTATGGTGVTVTPGTGDIAVTGLSPSVAVAQTLTPGTSVVVISGMPAHVSNGIAPLTGKQLKIVAPVHPGQLM